MSVHKLDPNRSDQSNMSADEAEWRLRVDVAAACRLAALYGWDDQIATHITARLPGEGHRFLINPFGFYFEEVTASSLMILDEHGNADREGPLNLAGFTVHSAIHMNREDAHAVVHLHTVAGIAVSASKGGLRNISHNTMMVYPVVYHDWEGVVINPDERGRLARDIGTANAMLLRNHGSLTVGRTMAEAFQRAYFLQRACEVQVAAAAQGDLIEQPDSISELVQRQTSTKFADSSMLNWEALLRKLDRLDPSFRN